MVGKVNAEDYLVNMGSILIVLTSYRDYGYSSDKLRKRTRTCLNILHRLSPRACLLHSSSDPKMWINIATTVEAAHRFVLFCLLTVCWRESHYLVQVGLKLSVLP